VAIKPDHSSAGDFTTEGRAVQNPTPAGSEKGTWEGKNYNRVETKKGRKGGALPALSLTDR
jgi:hypothetical protein